MARTKRKVNPIVSEPVSVPVEKVCRTAAYIRLSLEDNGKPGADTIEGQKRFVTQYIESNPTLALCAVYCDNGHTGADFERPAFDKLMEAVKNGEIDCIVCKDLSRFGRNYKETGNYLERIFPFLGIRFIAINDNFDSMTAERNEYGFIVPLKNLINETYSRDISKKVSAALEAKERRGEFIGVWAPYGYSKSKNDRHKLTVNPETAPVIKEIFALRMTGLGYGKIVRILNERGIPSPSVYLYKNGLTKNEKYRDTLWTVWNIKEILRNEIYIGNLIQGKRTQQSYKKARDERYAPPEEWRITHNAHEVIIDEDTFRAAQNISENRKASYEKMLAESDVTKSENMLCGLIFCADCGRAMSRRQSTSNKTTGREYYYVYVCPTAFNKADACTKKNIYESDLHITVMDTIRCHLNAVAELEQRITVICEEHSAADKRLYETQIKAAERELERSQRLSDSLYQNLADGIVTRQEYQAMKEQYENQCGSIRKHIEEIKLENNKQERLSPSNPMFIALQKFYEEDAISSELTHALISRIEIGTDRSIAIKLNYQDEFESLVRYVSEAAL